MIIQADQRILTHYGIRGMKWGIRNDKSGDARRSQANKVKSTLRKEGFGVVSNKSDFHEADWASKSVPEKLARQITTQVALNMLGSLMGKGKYPDFKDPKWGLQIAAETALNYGVNEITSKNAMKRYTDEGKRDKSKKQYQNLTPEHAIRFGISAGILAGQVGAKAGTKKLSEVVKTRRETEARMDSWGSRIFDTKTSDMHTIYDDGYMSILEKIKP